MPCDFTSRACGQKPKHTPDSPEQTRRRHHAVVGADAVAPGGFALGAHLDLDVLGTLVGIQNVQARKGRDGGAGV